MRLLGTFSSARGSTLRSVSPRTVKTILNGGTAASLDRMVSLNKDPQFPYSKSKDIFKEQ